MKSILITGGTGFVGKSLLDFLAGEKGKYRVVVQSRGKKAFDVGTWKGLNLEHITCNIRELSLKNYKPFDLVIHAATSTDQQETLNVKYLQETILDGTINLLSELAKNPPGAMMFLSSGAVYEGITGNRPFRESDCPVNTVASPKSYSEFKRSAEYLCHEFHLKTKVPTSIARLFAFAGPQLSLTENFALTSFLKSAVEGRDISIRGDGKAVRTYLAADDLCHWLMTVSDKTRAFEVVNVGSDEKVTILDLANEVGRLSGLPVKLGGSREERSNIYVPDITVASKMGLRPSVSIFNYLKKLLVFHGVNLTS